MKNLKFIVLILSVLVSYWSCQTEELDAGLNGESNFETTDRSMVNSKLQNRAFISEALMNNAADNAFVRKMQVYTPPGYKKNGDVAYPVVYLLHGFPFSEKAFIDSSEWDEWLTPYLFSQEYPDFPVEGFRLWIDNLIENDIIEPMIIVMPNGEADPYGFSFYSNSMLNGNYEDFIVQDLVDYMDENYNTIADPSGRAIIGHSQGGYAAFKFGMLHPDVFGTVASHSGLLFIDALFGYADLIAYENPDGFVGPDPTKFMTSAMYAMAGAWSPNLNNPPFYVDLPFEFDGAGNLYPVPEVMDLWHQNDVFTLLETYYSEFSALDGIYFDVGLLDELGTHLAHQPVIQKLNAYGINYTLETYEGGHHTHMFERLARSLEFCSGSMQ